MDINYIILSNSLPFEENGYSTQTAHKLIKQGLTDFKPASWVVVKAV